MDYQIPTFAADGRRLRPYSVGQIERLLARDAVVVRRNARGKILCAQFRAINGANPLRGSIHMGTVYSFEQHVNDSYVWSHRRLLQSQEVESLMGEPVEDLETLDRYLRNIFAAVPLSCASYAHA